MYLKENRNVSKKEYNIQIYKGEMYSREKWCITKKKNISKKG